MLLATLCRAPPVAMTTRSPGAICPGSGDSIAASFVASGDGTSTYSSVAVAVPNELWCATPSVTVVMTIGWPFFTLRYTSVPGTARGAATAADVEVGVVLGVGVGVEVHPPAPMATITAAP